MFSRTRPQPKTSERRRVQSWGRNKCLTCLAVRIMIEPMEYIVLLTAVTFARIIGRSWIAALPVMGVMYAIYQMAGGFNG